MRSGEGRDCGPGRERGFASFLRSLLAGLPWSERAEIEETVRIAAPVAGAFRVHNANGRLKIRGEDRDDIQMVAMKTARAQSAEAATELLSEIRLVFTETPEGLDLEVEAPSKWGPRCTANLCLQLPQHLHVAASSVNGRVEIEGIRGSVKARSSNGSVRISDVCGDVHVSTSNAKVFCSCIEGRLVARSSNGKIEIDQHRGSVDASTSNGLITADLDGVDEGGVQLATSNGRIVLDLPDEVDADVDIRVDNGVIRNDRKLCRASRETNGRVVGTLGAGGALIKLRTSNGSISLR